MNRVFFKENSFIFLLFYYLTIANINEYFCYILLKPKIVVKLCMRYQQLC